MSHEDDVKQWRELVVDIHSRAYEKAAAYTNLVMLGGYAAAFAIWHLSQSSLGPAASAWVALLLLLSVTSFVLFEVYKMVVHARHSMRIGHVLKQEIPVSDQLEQVRVIENSTDENGFLVQMPVWIVCLSFSVGTALTAVIILIWNLAGTVFAAL